MPTMPSAGARKGGWRRDAIIGAAAAALILAGAGRLACRSCGGRRQVELPPHLTEQASSIGRYCPQCKRVFVLSRRELEKLPGNEPLVVKARKVPCPTCGSTRTLEAVACRHCGHFVPVYADPGEAGARRCPKCGRNPFLAPRAAGAAPSPK